ncbi:MAG: L-threonylcarbamoyladenylate synthase [Treponema sp.]|nr:L-threonylcarbamoyladenylate synthase [Treponema sp.]
MKLLPISPESLEQGGIILKNGGLVAFPTETVYGLGADAFNPQALAKIFEVKGRPHFDPLIIHIAAIKTLDKVADLSLLNEETKKKLFLLAENLWPGPLSIVLPKNEKIPGIATAGLQTAAIRFPDHEAAQKLIYLSTGAVAAPSANPFGSLSPTKAEHVQNGLGEKPDLILDGGPTRIGLESTVLDITGDVIKILRPGGTPKEAIEKLVGCTQLTINNEQLTVNNKQNALVSPGLLKSHYAPRTPLYVLSRDEIINKPISLNSNENQKIAYLFFDEAARNEWHNKQKPSETVIVKVLSQKGDSLEAASCLFEILHELDNFNLSNIYAQSAPNIGLGEAINDRLRRGSVKNY